jgi:serine/threonine protein kinase
MFDLIGKTVGPYRILEQIGAGGMATVYKAYQPSMDRYIAIKVLPAHLSRDPDFTKRFQREARAISRLEHSHILPVYDYGEYEGITYIAMRYIKAGTLKDRMSMGGLSLDEINRLISQIGGALDYAHRMGVIHRDVKPANILIDDQGDVYLSDFGLARMMEPTQQLTESGVGLGTPAYMSPEQGQGIKVDHRSDIYSLGVILYEMLTGRVPYEAETPMAVVFQHIHGDLPLPHSINANTPEPVERVVLKALTKDPADRYQTAGEMVQALNSAVRMMDVEEKQQTIVDQVVPVQQATSIGTRLQNLWDQPRGKIMLGSGALAVITLLGFLLIQLPGHITILAPNPNPENTPVTGLETQAATFESSAQTTSPPVTTTASLATQQVPQPASTLTPSDYGPLLYEENFDQDTGRWTLDKGSYIQNGELIIPAGASVGPGLDAHEYNDFIFETEFRFLDPKSSTFSVYLGCQPYPCSDQVGVIFDGHLLAWRPDGTSSAPQILAPTLVSQLGPNKANRLTIFVHEDEFRIFVNGIFVRSFTDSTYRPGIFLLDADNAATAFDYVRIYAIPPVSNVPSLPAPQGELIFDENFDDGIANGITPDNTKWEIVDDNNGGKSFQIDNMPGADWIGFHLLDTITIADGTIEYKFKVVDYDISSGGILPGTVICNFRARPDETYLFVTTFDGGVVSMNYSLKDGRGGWQLLDNALALHIFEKNAWYTVRIDIKGNEFTAYIDGKKVLTARDDRIGAGQIFWGIVPNTSAQFDDVRVWAQP